MQEIKKQLTDLIKIQRSLINVLMDTDKRLRKLEQRGGTEVSNKDGEIKIKIL